MLFCTKTGLEVHIVNITINEDNFFPKLQIKKNLVAHIYSLAIITLINF